TLYTESPFSISVSFCDFESPCSWTLSSHSSGGDWYVTSPQQHQSIRRGIQPIRDYSTGKFDGHFLSLKPNSVHPALGRCSFYISSPVALSTGPLCRLHLARFQPELHTGNISAFVQHIDSTAVRPIELTVKEPATDRTQWEVIEAVIGQLEEPFQVTLQYSSCNSHEVGFLAFDSLELKDCVMDSLPLGSYCSFELGTCGWSVAETPSSWSLVSGQQLIENTHLLGTALQNTQGKYEAYDPSDITTEHILKIIKPKTDHSIRSCVHTFDSEYLLYSSTLASGHFLFLKVRGHTEGLEAMVQSPALPPTVSRQDCQLQFSLYLFGEFNGTLLLSVVENEASVSAQVWERSGHWMDTWQGVTLPIVKLLTGFHLKVQAFWTSGSKADIALDDISLSAACFDTGNLSASQLNDLLLGQGLLHDLDSFGPLPEPSSSGTLHFNISYLEQHMLISEASLLTWWFTSCGASGPLGPTQAQCDSAYRNTNVSVLVGKEGQLRGFQMWRVPATNMYKISAYGAAGGKGAKNHNKRSHGVIISAIFPLEKGDLLYILIGHQGEDACPGRNPLTHKICLGESSVIEDGFDSDGSALKWAGGGGGGGGATYIYRMENGQPVPLLIAAGGGGKAYLEDPESSQDQIFIEQYENDTSVSGGNGKSGASGGGGGWSDSSSLPWAGKSLVEGGQGGSSCLEALSVLGWATFGGFGGGGGACTAGGGGGGYRGGDAPLIDGITADGQDGISFVHPTGKIFLQPLAAMESHGEAEIKVYLNCSHCQTQSCRRDEETRVILCLCDSDELLAPDNITCIVVPLGSLADGPPSLIFILAVIASTVVTGVVLTCASLSLSKKLFQFCVNSVGSLFLGFLFSLLTLGQPPAGFASCLMTKGMLSPPRSAHADYQPASGTQAASSEVYYRKKNHLHAVRIRLQSPEYKLSKIRSSTIMTDYNPNYCFAGKAASLSELKEVPRKNITLLRALGHGAFGEVYEGQVFGMNGENTAMQVAIKTLPEICSEQDEMDFLMEALIMSLQILPRFILLELMTGGDMKSFLRLNRPRTNQSSSLSMLELLQMARDIALGCRYLEENHFIHRDIAARNCLLTCPGPERVAKIGDFGMARDIYRASYYRKGGRAMLPVKWMPPEAFLEGIFTCKTDTWSFGVLLWEIFSLGYMPYPCKTNQEVLEFVTSGGRMDPPKSCPGPVYRIMTQCWQHCPEHRPNFMTILERINYCTQDPDVINTPLPVECGPVDEEGSIVIRPEGSGSMTPLLSSQAMSQEASYNPGITIVTPPVIKPHQLQRPVHLTQEIATYKEALEPSWAEPIPASGACPGQWLQVPDHQPCSRSSSSSGSQKLKNKTKNLWNPTYGSWVLESFGRGKTALCQTQSMPLSCNLTSAATPSSTSEPTDPGVEVKTDVSDIPPLTSTSSINPTGAPSHKCPAGAMGSSTVMDLAKLQNFPCGNVNYAYDKQSYETESLPSSLDSSLAALSLAMTSAQRPLVKGQASYGHEDVRISTQPEKPTRDRDSGFSLSEDLSVTPV
ncbi:hypothetical protein DNTS_034410, partial [Danionella cerebrum]